jgi:DNA repair exonuclease SbcCD ATPase subunit
MELPLPKSKNITHVIHLADIHIRDGDIIRSRYDEYISVYDNFFKSIKKHPNINSTVAIIVGDIFHFKNKLDSLSIKSFNYLIYNLAEICPVYILCGNHDMQQSKQEIPDVLSSILYNQHHSNIAYINKTGHYIAGSVGFGVVEIKDTLLMGSGAGQATNLIDFPDPSFFDNKGIKTKIALFHGTIINSKLQNYTNSTTGYPIEWIDKGYTFALLGDIHLQQINKTNNGLVWGYSGSLVQQNFGEPLLGHGYILWDISTSIKENDKVAIPYHVYNPNGLAYVKYINNEWFIYINSKTIINIDDYVLDSNHPRNLLIIIKGQYENYDKLIEKLKFNNITFKIIKNIFDVQQSNNNLSDELNNESFDINGEIEMYNSQEMWVSYISKQSDINLNETLWKDYILNLNTLNVTIYPDNMKEKAIERNKEIDKLIIKVKDDLEYVKFKSKESIDIEYIEWNWMSCYGKDNYINFSNMKNNICVINANNDFGKSSFLDIICYALFGKGIISRYTDEYSVAIINRQKPENETCNVEIIFKIKDDSYKIRRTFAIDSVNPNKLHPTYCNLYKLLRDNDNSSATSTFVELKTGAPSVKTWVADNIGSIEGFLTSCMLTQNADKNFFTLSKNEQIEYFDKSLHINSVGSFQSLLKESLSANKFILDSTIHQHKLISDTFDFNQNEYDEIESNYNELKTKVDDIKININNIKETWHSFSDKELNMSINSIEDKIEELKLNLNEIDIDIDINIDINNDYIMKELGKYTNLYNNKICTPSKILELNNEELIEPNISYNDINIYINNIDICSNDSDSCLFKSMTINEIETEIEILSNKLNKNIIVPELTIEQYNEYNSKFNNLLKRITIDINQLLSINELNKPSTNYEKLKYDCESDYKKLIDKELYNLNEDSLNNLYNEIEVQYNDICTNIKNSEQIINDLENNKFNLEEVSQKLNKLYKTKPTKPNIEQNIISKLDSYNYKIVNDNINKYNLLVNKFNDFESETETINKKIADIKKYNHPYNDKCSACKNQLWKKQLTEYENRLSIINKEVNNITNNIDKFKETIDVNKLEEEYLLYNKYSNFEEIKEQWKTYNKYLIDIGLLEKEYKITKELSIENNNSLLSEKERLKKYKQLFIEINSKYSDIKFANGNINKWIMFKEQEDIYKEYEYNKSFIELKNEYISLINKKEYYDNQLNIINDYNKYIDIKKQLDNLVNYKKYNEYLSYKNIWENINYNYYVKIYELNMILNKIKEHNKITNDINHYTNLLKCLPDYINKKELSVQLKTEEYKLMNIINVYAKMKQKLEQYTSNNKNKEQLTLIINEVRNKIITIETIIKLMTTFKSWLYENVLIPNIINKTNNIMNAITENESYELVGEVKTSKRVGSDLSISWFIKNTKCKNVIEKSGGFRKFIAELSLRIAINSIGASNVLCKQIFLDEGFVACDPENLSKIPNFLSSLINSGLYDSVFLVSHLEEIKDCADISISITRSDDFISKLSYGECLNKKVLKQIANEKANEKILNTKSKSDTNELCSFVKTDKTTCKCKRTSELYCSRHENIVNKK